MKCENCGSELVGGAIVCRQCNHNSAQGRVSQWRARRTGDLQPPPTRTISPLADAAKPANSGRLVNTGSLRQGAAESRTLEPRRSNSIPFEPKIQIHLAPPSPGSSSKGSSGSLSSGSLSPHPAAKDDSETPETMDQPVWRAELKDRVKQSRERKIAGPIALANAADEAELDPNPIVEAALKRIRWAAHTPSAASTLRATRHGAQATALAEEPEFDVEPPAPIELKAPALKIEPPVELKANPKPTTRVAPTQTNPLLARRPNTQPVNQPETNPLPHPQPARPPVMPKPQIRTAAESRIEIEPAAKPETKPVAESRIAESKSRVTGDLKPPAAAPLPSSQPVAKPSAEKITPVPASAPVRKTVETKVIELPQPTAASPSAKPKPAAKDRSATIWVRTLAGACDFEIVAVGYLPLFAPYATLNTSLGRDSLALMFLLLAVLTFCYQLLTLTLADRTSGMALLNLRLVNIAGVGKPIVFTQKFARAVAATAAFLCPPLNLIVMQSNPRRYTLPDLLSGTTLVEK